ncbi:MAG: GTP 3',8-cyclase MoaA [Nitriliruptorales bacterium]|nr:GTP 3',8-cyclase MoaA [Nitriliruptorales bacterium]
MLVRVNVTDTRDRPLRDLRVSVTDRCNFRCTYCMPRELFGPDHAFVPRDELLTFEEIARIVEAFARAGVTTVRLTGGEPLLRRDLTLLVRMLTAIPGVDDLAMTTNGALLQRVAGGLADAGLRRVTVSLDALDPDTFRRMSDTTTDVHVVLDALHAAKGAGLWPVKVNAVIRRGVNEDQVVPLARLGRDEGYVVRFIEYMDVGHTNGWRRDEVVAAAEVVDRVHAAFPLEPLAPRRDGETANRYRYLDGAGEIGVIASVTQPFCGACTRARLSPVGELFTCLFATRGTDLRAIVRNGEDDAFLDAAVEGVWQRRTDRYSELRTAATAGMPKVEMSYIGG